MSIQPDVLVQLILSRDGLEVFQDFSLGRVAGRRRYSNQPSGCGDQANDGAGGYPPSKIAVHHSQFRPVGMRLPGILVNMGRQITRTSGVSSLMSDCNRRPRQRVYSATRTIHLVTPQIKGLGVYVTHEFSNHVPPTSAFFS